MNKEIKDLLLSKALEYEHPNFIEQDPILIPHLFQQKEDIEIAAFFTAIIAWGNRASIIKSAKNILNIMGNAPHEFIMEHSAQDLILPASLHRTFLAEDFKVFCTQLKIIYTQHQDLETFFGQKIIQEGMAKGISDFKQAFFGLQLNQRSAKHLSDPLKNSAAKRLVMFLRWMCRSNHKGVDFGIWSAIPTKDLFVPLDVHTATVARKLNLITRKQNDWKTLEELMVALRKIHPNDPASLDFALFGMGVYKSL